MSHQRRPIKECLRCGALGKREPQTLVCRSCRRAIQIALHWQGTLTRLDMLEYLFAEYWQQWENPRVTGQAA